MVIVSYLILRSFKLVKLRAGIAARQTKQNKQQDLPQELAAIHPASVVAAGDLF